MKCPIRMLSHQAAFVGDYGETLDCLGEECAWWTPLSSCCSIRDLPGILIAAGNVLGLICSELRHTKYRYTCHRCGLIIEKTAAGETKEPDGWTIFEQVDGRHVWICGRCQD